MSNVRLVKNATNALSVGGNFVHQYSKIGHLTIKSLY